jgi:hypothetical protein
LTNVLVILLGALTSLIVSVSSMELKSQIANAKLPGAVKRMLEKRCSLWFKEHHSLLLLVVFNSTVTRKGKEDTRILGSTSLVVLEDRIEWVEVDGAESGEAGGEAEAAELLLGALPPLRPVGGHDEDVVLEQGPGPGAGVGLLRHHRLAGDDLAAGRQRAVAVAQDGPALVVGPRRQNPLPV